MTSPPPPSMLNRVLVFSGIVAVTAAAALLVADRLDIDSRGAVLCVYGVLLLILSVGPSRWYEAIRHFGLIQGVHENDVMRLTLRLIGALLCVIGLLIISFS